MLADPANYAIPYELAGDSSKADGLSNGLKVQALLRPNEKSQAVAALPSFSRSYLPSFTEGLFQCYHPSLPKTIKPASRNRVCLIMANMQNAPG